MKIKIGNLYKMLLFHNHNLNMSNKEYIIYIYIYYSFMPSLDHYIR